MAYIHSTERKVGYPEHCKVYVVIPNQSQTEEVFVPNFIKLIYSDGLLLHAHYPAYILPNEFIEYDKNSKGKIIQIHNALEW